MAVNRLQACFNSCDSIWVYVKVSILLILEGLGAVFSYFQNKYSSFEVYLWLMWKLLKVLQLAQAKKPHNN